MLAVQPAANDIYTEHIIKPFISFLKTMIQSGANTNAYVLKLKQFRDDAESTLFT
jgi:hypothetical protein